MDHPLAEKSYSETVCLSGITQCHPLLVSDPLSCAGKAVFFLYSVQKTSSHVHTRYEIPMADLAKSTSMYAFQVICIILDHFKTKTDL